MSPSPSSFRLHHESVLVLLLALRYQAQARPRRRVWESPLQATPLTLSKAISSCAWCRRETDPSAPHSSRISSCSTSVRLACSILFIQQSGFDYCNGTRPRNISVFTECIRTNLQHLHTLWLNAHQNVHSWEEEENNGSGLPWISFGLDKDEGISNVVAVALRNVNDKFDYVPPLWATNCHWGTQGQHLCEDCHSAARYHREIQTINKCKVSGFRKRVDGNGRTEHTNSTFGFHPHPEILLQWLEA